MAPGQPRPITDDHEYVASVKNRIGDPRHSIVRTGAGIHAEAYEVVDRLIEICERRQAKIAHLEKLAPWTKNPRMRIVGVAGVEGLEGHVVENRADGVLLMIDGNAFPNLFFQENVEAVEVKSCCSSKPGHPSGFDSVTWHA